ncbi:Formin-like protein 3 [Lamellibrachia satsuma]|nr:Formin-like protein 3 [Lamellibrachia satsuma]
MLSESSDRDREAMTVNTWEESMPDSQQIRQEFDEYLEVVGRLSEEEEDRLRSMSLQEKWRIIFNKQTRSPLLGVTHYVENLRKHVGLHHRKLSVRRMAKEGIAPLSQLLSKLKLDLKMSYDSFALDFVAAPNNGAWLLLDILREIQLDQNAMNSSTKAKDEQYRQTLINEFDCLLCLKYAAKVEEGLTKLVRCSAAVETVAVGLMSSFNKTRVVALQLITAICEVPGGFYQVMDALTKLRINFGETVRFKMLVNMLTNPDCVQFQTVCVRFFNTLWNCMENSNAKVYLQHELEVAGFDPDLLVQDITETDAEMAELQKEVETWRRNYINVNVTRQEANALESRNTQLRQEIDRLGHMVKEWEESKEAWEGAEARWKEKCENYRERAAELQDTVSKLTKLYQEKTGSDPSTKINVESAYKSLDIYGSGRGIDRFGTTTSKTSLTTNSVDAPLHPAPPAPAPPTFLSPTVKKKVTATKANLPLLNWTPIYNISQTVFQEIDNEALLREIDFSELEEKFELPKRVESHESQQKRKHALLRANNQVCFIDGNRAKNMVITKRRTGLSSRQLKDAIEKCDLDRLPGEYAGLLLNYMPTKEELKLLASNAKQYSKMAEAEQFLFQMAQVERLQSKLSMMAFMGVFEELVSSLIPQMKCVHEASESLAKTKKLKKILEVVLAFGNYMNSNKRGFVTGFKLQSLTKLSDVKSCDRTMTLMHYLVEFIRTTYPKLKDFHEELNIDVTKGGEFETVDIDVTKGGEFETVDIDVTKGGEFETVDIDVTKGGEFETVDIDVTKGGEFETVDIDVTKGVSYQMIASDVHGLRKGMDLIKFEKEKQPLNQTIAEFESTARERVTAVAAMFQEMEESYRVVCSMHGENYKLIEPDEFFGHIEHFVSAFVKAEDENYRRDHLEKCCSTSSSLNNSKFKLPTEDSMLKDAMPPANEKASVVSNGLPGRERYPGKIEHTKSISFSDRNQVITVNNHGYDQVYYDDVKTQTVKHNTSNSDNTTFTHVTNSGRFPVVKTDITSWDEMTQVYRSALSEANPHLDSSVAKYDGATVLVGSNNQLSSLTNGQARSEVSALLSSGSTTNIHVYCSGDVNVNSGVVAQPTRSTDLGLQAVGATTKVYCTDDVGADLHPSGVCCIEDADGKAANTSRTAIVTPKYALCNGRQRDDVIGGFQLKPGNVTSPPASMHNGGGRYSEQVCEALDELDAVVTSFTLDGVIAELSEDSQM